MAGFKHDKCSKPTISIKRSSHQPSEGDNQVFQAFHGAAKCFSRTSARDQSRELQRTGHIRLQTEGDKQPRKIGEQQYHASIAMVRQLSHRFDPLEHGLEHGMGFWEVSSRKPSSQDEKLL